MKGSDPPLRYPSNDSMLTIFPKNLIIKRIVPYYYSPTDLMIIREVQKQIWFSQIYTFYFSFSRSVF